MKRTLSAILLASLATAATAQDADQSGKIVMYRVGNLMGVATACPIRYKGHELVELGRNRFATWNVKPGRYILASKTSSVEVAVDAGETRYVRCAMKLGLMWRADLQIADSDEFDANKADYEEKAVAIPKQ